MLVLVLVPFVALIFILFACSGFVSIFVDDAVKRQDAFKVLKLLIKITFGTGGLIALLVKLYEMGILHWPLW